MIQIFNKLRQGYKPRFKWEIFRGWDEQYDGYVIIFYDRPRIVWEPTVKTIGAVIDDDIPF